MPAVVSVELLGRCVIRVGDRRMDPGAELVFAGLLYLALNRGKGIARTELAEVLWPDAEHSVRAERLRWLLTKLRGLGVPLHSSHAEVTLRAEFVALDCDEMGSMELDRLDAAFRGYAPSFSAAFGHWLDHIRDQTATDILRMLAPRLHAATRGDDPDAVIDVGHAVLRLDPLDQDATIHVAEAYCKLGSRARAIGLLEQLLASMPETSESIADVRLALSRTRSLATHGETEAGSRFIGRRDEMARIQSALSAARRGTGGGLLLVGVPGIGKTRLLQEAQVRASLEGMQVLVVRCQRGDMRRPLSGIVDVISRLLEMRGAAGCDPAKLHRLRLLTDAPDTSTTSAAREGALPEIVTRELFDATTDLLDAISSEAPLLIELDDAQWLNTSTNWFWDDLFAWSSSRPVVWLIAARALRRQSASMELPELRIGSLDAASADVLLDELLSAVGRKTDAETRGALLARGAGSPLFLRELVRRWNTTGSVQQLPSSHIALFEAALDGFSPHALRVLQVAAVLGTQATIERVERIVQLPRGAYLNAIAELEMAGALTAPPSGQLFGHVLWAEAALSRCSTNVARVIHRYAAELFERELELRPDGTLLWQAAHHWEESGHAQTARAVIVRGAEHLAQLGFPLDAAAAYGRAARSVIDPMERLPLLKRQAELLMAGDWESARPVIREYQHLSAEIDPLFDPHNDLELAELSIEFSSLGLAEYTGMHRLMQCVSSDAATARHRLYAAKEAAKITLVVPDPDVLIDIWSIARDIVPRDFREYWDRSFVQWCHEFIAGDIEQSVVIAEERLKNVRTEDVRSVLAPALEHVAQSYAVAGRFADALASYTEAIRVARECGQVHVESVLYDSLVGLSLDIESPKLVRHRLQNASPSLERAAKLGSRIMGEVTLPYHRAQLAVIEGHGREALQLIGDLDAARRTTFPRWRARLLAVQLEARRLCGMLDELDSIAAQIHECFVRPGHWLDWPATVLARYWLDTGRRQDAQRFASAYVTSGRRERYPAPELLLMLADAAGAYPPATAPTTRNGSLPSATA